MDFLHHTSLFISNFLFLIIIIFLAAAAFPSQENVHHHQAAAMSRDKASLISFMSGIVSDPHHALEDWNNNSNYIDLSNNSLSGKIPLRDGCELKKLRFLLLWSNHLVGQVPAALSNSLRLEWLDLESNMLSGELPSEIVAKMPQLQYLYLSYNDFVSHDGNTNLEPFLTSLVNASNFQELELAGNNLGGEIPSIIGDLSTNLVQIHLDDNLIYGSIPPHISNLVNLTLLNLSSNHLNGTIPSKLCRMRKLERVILVEQFTLRFANLSQLRRLLLYDNQLSGTIPPSLGKCINLEILDLSHNKISGVIPSEVAGLRSLKLYLNLSSNHLHGVVPMELSKMDMVLAIDLSSNNLSDTIPSQLGSCIALESLNISSNSLQGPVPVSIGKLPFLQKLDVSSNQLAGEIPESLQQSLTLKELNFSFNNFSGNVSNKGAFSVLTVNSFLGNAGLCGSIKGMPRCKKKNSHHLAILSVLLSLIITPIFCIVGYPLMHRSKIRRHLGIFDDGKLQDDDEEDGKEEHKYPRISYEQLIEATCGFSASNLIGSGRFGHVYKGGGVRVFRQMTRHPSSSADACYVDPIGYIAPEYGMENALRLREACIQFWVLLLDQTDVTSRAWRFDSGDQAEIVTGRRPTDVDFHKGSSLPEWIKTQYPRRLDPIVQQAVERCAPASMPKQYNKIWQDVVLELIEIGLMCTQHNPSLRPSMQDVAHEMSQVKEYISNPSSALLIEEVDIKVDSL
ncbi:hypothetical protein M0R45_002943 [Rubus argutus]|uniref:non-specific serine/threonine protein kinase n=1 Tax=Rubus argutus TaxID=59490 RepID=A0AAW1YH52_RUBAR